MKYRPRQEESLDNLIDFVPEDVEQLHDVTPEEHGYFQKACRVYQRAFGLVDWDLYFSSDDLSNDADLANISWCFTGHSANITLSKKMPFYENYTVELDKIARHEMIHLLLARIQEYAQRRNVNQEDIDESLESLVRMIDNVYLQGQELRHELL
jgi:hypothetical protein